MTIDDFPFDEILKNSNTGKELLNNSLEIADKAVVAEAITKYCALAKLTICINEYNVDGSEQICNTIIAILKNKIQEHYKYDDSLSEFDMAKAIYYDFNKDMYLASALVEHKNGGRIELSSNANIDPNMNDGKPYLAFYANYVDKNNVKTMIEEMR